MAKSIVIVIIIILLGGLVVQNASQKVQPTQNNYQANIYSPIKLNELLNKDRDKYVVIDVRTKQEYDKGHIPGAVHADYYDTDALKKAAGDKTPITYCAFSAMRGPYA